MKVSEMSGQMLDDKYRIERELGRGGMGTVYLAIHVGTERPVAIKVIAPQFMERPEFVERFRREARAAGRLRHPNVVNVTDFGFSESNDGRVAYLVMEYLDGCTLGEVLEEEKNLPVSWTLDILEQVCSAVHEAHEQGIIHRDLKPDNIWLEPNQRGGYTVKVLDFGIAKLESHSNDHSFDNDLQSSTGAPTFAQSGRATLVDVSRPGTHVDVGSNTVISESATMIQGTDDGLEKRTAILVPVLDENQESVGTRIMSDAGTLEHQQYIHDGGQSDITVSNDSDLTRVGAVLGTPLYMSPEQCRGEHLDPRSDVYSLGVIAYQMLSGGTPFSGNFTEVMDAHRETEPPPLNAKNVRKKLKRIITSALSKNREDRPQTAEAFSSILRSRSEGIFGLLRRAGMIYTEHMPKFIGLTILLFLPFVLATLLSVGSSFLFLSEEASTNQTIVKVGVTLLTVVTSFFCANLAVGTTTWIVNQILSFPLRPVRIKPALLATRANWKKLIGTGLLATTLTLLGYGLCVMPGLALSVALALVSPVVMMENLRGFTAMKRSKMLVMRSLRTTTAAVVILFLVPMIMGAAAGYVVAVSVKAFSAPAESVRDINGQTKEPSTESESTAPTVDGAAESADNLEITVSDGGPIRITSGKAASTPANRYKSVIREGLTALIMLPIQILLISLSSIIVALLYLKTRQAGGESLQDLIAKFEEADHPRKKWQERVRQRLIQSGRITSRS